MKCSTCGGTLIWDYERGEVVCSSCGLVHYTLTTLECQYYRVNNVEEDSTREQPRSIKPVVSREYRKLLRIYKKTIKLVKNKPWLEVDYNKIINEKKHVHAIKSKASIKAVKNIEEYGYWDIVKKGLEFINSVNPAFLARSERSKYALAYMVAVKLETGRYPSREDVVKIFNISNTSYNRLWSIAEKILKSPQFQPFNSQLENNAVFSS